MNIVFEYEDKKLILPVNPANVKVTKPSQSQKVEVLGIGEVSVPQTRKLASVSINSFFWQDLFNQQFLFSKVGTLSSYLPSTLASQLNSVANAIYNKIPSNIAGILDDSQKFRVLNEYVLWFEEWQASKKPARWTIVVPPNDPPQCYDFNVTCESFDYESKAGEENDYYYNIELLEWRNYGAKVLNAETKSDGTTQYNQEHNARLDVKAKVSEVQTTERDSIWSTAKKWCGNGDNWKDLYNEGVNKYVLSQRPQDLAGAVLKIPQSKGLL